MSHSIPPEAARGPARRKWRIWPALVAVPVFVILLVVMLWNWNWFRPLVESRASAALGRPVSIGVLHVAFWQGSDLHLAVLTADDVRLAQPKGFVAAGNTPFATIDHLVVAIDLWALIRDRAVVLPRIALDHPVLDVLQTADGQNNYSFPKSGSGGSTGGSSMPKIGNLVITAGHAKVALAQLRADLMLDIATQDTKDPRPSGQRIVVDAHGTYAAQPITGKLIAGALLSLEQSDHPYPIDLYLANGATHISLNGTIAQPLAFQGADLKLDLAGQDMANLLPLTGIPIPHTPPYRITGRLDDDAGRIRFDHFVGRVGSSDLEGEISVDPGKLRPMVIAQLSSNRVDITDLGGFIGAQPGREATPGQDEAQRAAKARALASPKLLPSTPINLPDIKSADFDVHYKGAHIINKDVPLDNVVAHLTILDGRIGLHPLDFAVGHGSIDSNIDLDGTGKVPRTVVAIDFRQVDLDRLMQATHTFGGAGSITGTARITSTGDSMAAILGRADGDLRLFMGKGGNLSALLVDLSGLEFGNAVLSALGVPNRATVECLVSDFVIRNGVLDTKALLLATTEADIFGTGTIDLGQEVLNYHLRTRARHFSIGSLAAPINITGTFKKPSVLPDLMTLGVRGGIAAGLGVVFPPLALLATIQLGNDDRNACTDALHRVQAPMPAVRAAPRRRTH